MPRSTRCAALLAFRRAAFACLGRRQDALFELMMLPVVAEPLIACRI
jgi:hypothetical protein